VYPELIDPEWIDSGLYPHIVAAADEDGLAQVPDRVGAR
jgi:hypothetical protein